MAAGTGEVGWCQDGAGVSEHVDGSHWLRRQAPALISWREAAKRAYDAARRRALECCFSKRDRASPKLGQGPLGLLAAIAIGHVDHCTSNGAPMKVASGERLRPLVAAATPSWNSRRGQWLLPSGCRYTRWKPT